MKHTKIILALIAVLNMSATSMAQTTPNGRFEWAKGYTSSEDACHIIGTVTDSVGNLYILGQYNDYRRCHYTLDLAGRPQAIYLLTLLTADGQQHTIRLIKRNKQ